MKDKQSSSLTPADLDKEVQHQSQPATPRKYIDNTIEAAKTVGMGVLGAGAAAANMKVTPLRKVE
ncbi:MAG: hypothetical protein EBU46_00020 [Nitrosomonadaceae bacterium]|nr:hypothetical protein [Nitrosomonadaceae bacterium]